MVRQRLISSHGHLAGKLGTGVLTGHPQVLSSYQYETGVPLSNPDSQDPISTHFPQGRDPNLLYHCFKHRGMLCCLVIVQSHIYNVTFNCDFALKKMLQTMADTWNLDVNGHTWRHQLQSRRSITFVHLLLTNHLYCLIHTALRRSLPERLVCMAAWKQSLGQQTGMT